MGFLDDLKDGLKEVDLKKVKEDIFGKELEYDSVREIGYIDFDKYIEKERNRFLKKDTEKLIKSYQKTDMISKEDKITREIIEQILIERKILFAFYQKQILTDVDKTILKILYDKYNKALYDKAKEEYDFLIKSKFYKKKKRAFLKVFKLDLLKRTHNIPRN